jgi:hypothetical protein
MQDWQRHELAQTRIETPVTHWMSAVRFISRSKGHRKTRRPRLVTLVKWGGHWKDLNGQLPWDEWATEVLGEQAEGSDLKDALELALFERKGKF